MTITNQHTPLTPPQAWDEFEAPCDFAQLPLTTADVASPMCEVKPHSTRYYLLWPYYTMCEVKPHSTRYYLLWLCYTMCEVLLHSTRKSTVAIEYDTMCEVELLQLMLPGYHPRSSCSAGAWGPARSGPSWAAWSRLGSR